MGAPIRWALGASLRVMAQGHRQNRCQVKGLPHGECPRSASGLILQASLMAQLPKGSLRAGAMGGTPRKPVRAGCPLMRRAGTS